MVEQLGLTHTSFTGGNKCESNKTTRRPWNRGEKIALGPDRTVLVGDCGIDDA